MKKLTIVLSYIAVFLLGMIGADFIISRYYPVGKLTELESLIDSHFIGEYDYEKMEDAAAEAMIGALGDRWSYYIPAADYSAYEDRTDNSYVGVGITIQKSDDPAGILIISVQKGSGAEAAGMQPTDLIIAINGEDVTDMTPSEAKRLVAGPEGTSVDFTLVRGGETLELSVERRRIISTVAEGQLLPGNIGLITIENFNNRCAEESIAAIEELLSQGAKALIFDVRNNPGGYVTELVALLDYLLPEGDLFRSVDYLGKETVMTSKSDFLDIPIAVLCNAESYSAAEFFAAAIQEYGAGKVVGEQTCGKGYFQYTLMLSDGSAAALSCGKYFTPKGNSLIGVGIVPDVPVEVDDEIFAKIYYGQLEPTDDPQIQAAMKLFQ